MSAPNTITPRAHDYLKHHSKFCAAISTLLSHTPNLVSCGLGQLHSVPLWAVNRRPLVTHVVSEASRPVACISVNMLQSNTRTLAA